MESRNGKRNTTKEKSREDKNPAMCKSPKKTVVRQLDLDMPSSGKKGETISCPETFVQEPQAPKTLEKSHVASLLNNQPLFKEGPEGVKWDWDWAKIWVGKWDLIHWDWDYCTGNGTQNIKWEWEFCFNPLSKKYFFGIKLKKNQLIALWSFYPIKNR